MKLIKFFILIFITGTVFGQVKTTKVTKVDIPADIHYVGHIVEAVRYNDYDGEHLVFTTETGILQSKHPIESEDLRVAELYVYNYKITGSKHSLAWKIHDFSGDCALDVTAKHVPNTFTTTDLNKDGKVEVWCMYRTACRGDVSPAAMKIIMYEGGKKYAVRGESKVLDETIPNHYFGGNYLLDNAFKSSLLNLKSMLKNFGKRM